MRWAWDLSETVVGESLLAKDVNDSAVCLVIRGVDSFFASELAPTVVCASEPDGVPQWVVSNPSHKPGTQRVAMMYRAAAFRSSSRRRARSK